MKITNDSHDSTASWDDVESQFLDRKEGTIQHLTDVWSKRLGVSSLKMEEKERSVTKETWTHDQLHQLLLSMEPYEPAMFTAMKPRRANKPPVIVKSEEVYFMIDGRRRSNLLYKISGMYEVLIVE